MSLQNITEIIVFRKLISEFFIVPNILNPKSYP